MDAVQPARAAAVALGMIATAPVLAQDLPGGDAVSACSRALSSAEIVNMVHLVRDMGTRYQEIFDSKLRGQCNRTEIFAFLKSSRSFHLMEIREYSSKSIDYFKYNPLPFPLNVLPVGYSIHIAYSLSGEFLESNWEVNAI